MTFLVLNLALAALVANHVVAVDTYLVADIFESEGKRCKKSSLEASIIHGVGGCISLPLNWLPEEHIMAKSYRINTCSEGRKHVELWMTLYEDEDCTGEETDLIKHMHNKCTMNKAFSCQAEPRALMEHWPAIGLNFQDETCQSSDVIIAAAPGCHTLGRDVWDSDTLEGTWEWKRDTDTDALLFITYSSPDACEAGIPSNTISSDAGECLQGGKLSEHINELLLLLEAKLPVEGPKRPPDTEMDISSSQLRRQLPKGHPKHPPGGPKLPPGDPKLPPGDPKLPPGSPKLPPKLPPAEMETSWLQQLSLLQRLLPKGHPKQPPGGPKLPPGDPKLPPGGPKLPPGDPKLPPGDPKLPPGGPKLPPRKLTADEVPRDPPEEYDGNYVVI